MKLRQPRQVTFWLPDWSGKLKPGQLWCTPLLDCGSGSECRTGKSRARCMGKRKSKAIKLYLASNVPVEE